MKPVPSQAQLAWHKMEMNAFVHFTTNTFTDKEWGYGDEDPLAFNPTQLNTDQWISTFKEAGFKGVILTCKHHDGFCLWPTQYTSHSVKSSPYKNGKGDVVGEVAASCKKFGLKFGLYVSPWDRHHAEYGGQEYIEYYRNQLYELFTNYGPVFEMWFDGANGGDGYYGGANETRDIDGATYYDWPTTLEAVQKLEPSIIFFSDAGPGVRWCGNERGIAGLTNWNIISPDTLYAGKPGITSLLNQGHENGTHWIPAEVDVSIRPGWFYHQNEDSLVKTPDQLFDIYLKSVGRGSTLLLNIPPDQRGLIHEQDQLSLQGFKEKLDATFSDNFAPKASITTDNSRGGDDEYAAINMIDGEYETFWATDDDVQQGEIILNFKEEKTLEYVMLQEYIPLGQRIKKFHIDSWQNDGWIKITEGTTIGYKRILQFEPVITEKLRIVISGSKACPVISNLEIY